jgi:hypothetical protein
LDELRIIVVVEGIHLTRDLTAKLYLFYRLLLYGFMFWMVGFSFGSHIGCQPLWKPLKDLLQSCNRQTERWRTRLTQMFVGFKVMKIMVSRMIAQQAHYLMSCLHACYV